MSPALGIDLDRTGEVPLGVQLAWALRMRILSGDLARGERLPGVRELAHDTGVNVNTVRSVYRRLEADGLIRPEHGRGTFVSEAAPVDDRVAAVARRALADAAEAGLDPRQVAAALYAQIGASPARAAAPEGPAARRAALRAEISELERALSDALVDRLAREVPARDARPTGGRLLNEHELRTLRDELAAQLAALHAPVPRPPAPRAESSSRSAATAPGIVRFRTAPGAA